MTSSKGTGSNRMARHASKLKVTSASPRSSPKISPRNSKCSQGENSEDIDYFEERKSVWVNSQPDHIHSMGRSQCNAPARPVQDTTQSQIQPETAPLGSLPPVPHGTEACHGDSKLTQAMPPLPNVQLGKTGQREALNTASHNPAQGALEPGQVT